MTIDNLKQQKIWVCWRYETRNDKRTKVPITPGGAAVGTSPTYAHKWVTYDEAVKAAAENGYDGVGFVIPEGLFFLDIDHKELSDPFVQTILSRFNTYAERSVSGEGIHVYGKVDIAEIPTRQDKNGKQRLDTTRYYTKNPHNSMEIYFGGLTNRFAAYTGDVVVDAPLRDCTEAILITLDTDMRRSKKKMRYSAKRDGDRVTFDIICSLRKQTNGEKFSKLFDDGDYSDYGSPSEADAALCSIIAFRTGPNPEMIDAIFRQSALYRDKWEREDYRDATIAFGIQSCNGTFHQSVMPHPEFIRFDQKTGAPRVVVPLLAKYVREHLHYILVRDNGKQGLLTYVYEGGCYRLYSKDMLMGVIKRYIANYDEELVKMAQVTETLQHIVTDLDYVSQDNLNSDETLINFRNGLLRVTADSVTLLPHTPSVYSTIQIPCDWTGEPKPTPTFDRYMKMLTNRDAGIEWLLMEILGAIISNVKCWRMKKALFLLGPGDSGKSVLKSLVEMIIGAENYAGIDLKEIEERFGTGAIYGTRLAGSSDMSFLSVSEMKVFKQLTGGDSVSAEFKGLQKFDYVYNGFLWFCMNQLPKFGGDDGQWVYDRIMVVECPNVIPKDKQDKHLLDKLYAEREGIIYKAVKALQTVIANGYCFSEPKRVSRAREEYMAENNTVISFFQECMCPGKPNGYCTTGRVYRIYQAWCRENNHGYAKTAKEFREALAGYLGGSFADVTTRQKGNTFYRDYTLTQEAKDLFSKEYGYDGTDFLMPA